MTLLFPSEAMLLASRWAKKVRVKRASSPVRGTPAAPGQSTPASSGGASTQAPSHASGDSAHEKGEGVSPVAPQAREGAPDRGET